MKRIATLTALLITAATLAFAQSLPVIQYVVFPGIKRRYGLSFPAGQEVA